MVSPHSPSLRLAAWRREGPSAQRSAAVLMMQQVLQGFDEPGGSSGAELRAAAACGEALCATYNRVPLLIGEMVDLCACMLAGALWSLATALPFPPSLAH